MKDDRRAQEKKKDRTKAKKPRPCRELQTHLDPEKGKVKKRMRREASLIRGRKEKNRISL